METRHITAVDMMAVKLNPKDFGITAIKKHRCDNCGETIEPGHVYVSRIIPSYMDGRYPTAEKAWTQRMGGCLRVKEHLACSPWGGKRILAMMLEMVGNGRYKYRWRRSGARSWL